MSDEISLKIVIDGKEAIASIKITEEEVLKLAKAVRNAGEESRTSGSKLVHSFAEARNLLQGIKESYYALESILSTPIRAAIDLEQAIASFEVLTGSAERGQKLLKEIADFSSKTPLTMPSLQDAAKTMLNFGISAESILPNLKMLGDISGGNAQKLQSLTLAFSQIQSTGRLTGQDLLQLINAGFNPLKVIAEQTGKSISQLKKDMEEGAISADMVKDAFKTATSEGGLFFGMLEKQSETLGGRLSTLEDNFIKVQQAIGGTVAIGLSPMINNLITTINFTHSLSPALTGVIGAVGALTVAAVMLRTVGILPMIINVDLLKNGLIASAMALQTTAAAGHKFAASMVAAQTAVKAFFASLGVVGWAIIGISALTTVIGLLASTTSDASDKNEKLKTSFDTMKLDQLRGELNKTDAAILPTRKRLEELNKEYQTLAKTGGSLKLLRSKLAEIEEIQSNLNKLNDYRAVITQQIAEKEKQIAESLERSYKQIRDAMNVELEKGDTAKLLKKEKQDYEERVKLIKENALINKTSDEQLKQDLLDAEKIYNQKVKVIKSDAWEKQREKDFEKKRDMLAETQRHAEKMASIETENNALILKIKINHLAEMMELYKKYGKDITRLVNEQKEAEAELSAFKKKGNEDIKAFEKNIVPDEIDTEDQSIGNIKEHSDWVYEAVDAYDALSNAMSSAWSSQVQLIANNNSMLQQAINYLGMYITKLLAMSAFKSLLNFMLPGLGILIPATAEGGIVTSPQVRLVGEAGPEAIIPLNKYYFNQQPVIVNTNVNLQGEAEIGLNKLYFKLRKIEEVIKNKF